MESVANRRAVEPDQASDTFAVCNKCSRLSFNLKACDKCGSPLSEEDSSNCFSSEPKRARIETPPETNGFESPADGETLSADAERNNTPAVPSVRPQALFVNMNNHAVPFNNNVGMAASHGMVVSGAGVVSTQPVVSFSNGQNTQSASASRLRPNILAPGRLPQPVPVAMTINGVAAAQGGMVPGVQTNHRPMPPNAAYSAPQRMTVNQSCLPSYNLQPPPPPFSTNVARLPVVVSSSSSIPTMVASSATPQSTQSWQVTAIEIRIGSKKFKPMSPVTFKDEGVLFMLKDFTYAPVLLNTRAIIKCRANLSTFSYPVLFLYLENSCMRQMRNIFGLQPNEFNSSSPAELRRCISIFPVFGSENRSQVQSVQYSIKRTFEAMVRRYPRSTPILEEITNEQVIDILIESSASDVVGGGAINGSAEGEQDNAVDGNSENGASAAGTNGAAAASFSGPAFTSLNSVSHSRNVVQPHQTNAASNVLLEARQFAANAASGSTPLVAPAMQNAPQVLVIPQDAGRWSALQKSLVVGGVYHVMAHTGQRKYCLWNGTQLVPCMVQNTEVQLNCSRVRIGSLHALSVGQVRIRADPGSGIFFTIKSETSGQMEVSICPDDILGCEVCFNKITTVIFINTAWSTADKLRTKLGMQSGRDPSFDPSSSDVRKKYIILFLNEVNRDQEEALTQMKFLRTPTQQKAFDVMDLANGIFRLAQIKMDLKSATEVMAYINSNKLSGSVGFERLVREVAESDGMSASAQADDDDDDDVIMTQEEVGIKCPYTQQVMKEPVRNKVCGHNYERMAIMEFIVRKKGNAKCPYAGCGQTTSLRVEDLVENVQLKEYIAKNAATINSGS